jgi:arylsulfatase A-like enzyme
MFSTTSPTGFLARWAATSLLCSACEEQPAIHADAARKSASVLPDVVLVSVDSLRADHLGCYGYGPPTSPTLDALAQGGIRFAAAYSTTSWTLPAHAALFTGLFDVSHGLIDKTLRLGEQHETLAELLRAQGYQTAGFFSGPFLHPSFGVAQGFETYVNCMSQNPVRGGLRDDLDAIHRNSHEDITGPKILAAVEDFLDQAEVQEPHRPLFLFLHLWDVHYDYIPPPAFVEMFDPDYKGSIDGRNFFENADVRAEMSPRDLQHLLALYDGEIRFTDDILRQILAALERRGRSEKTLLVVTADHGDEFFEHGGKGHQRTLYEEVVRIPLILHFPARLPAARVVRSPVSIIDIATTILALVGLSAPEHIQGRDLAPLWQEQEAQGAQRAPVLLGLFADGRNLRGVRSGSRKMLLDNLTREEFFDLSADPGEQQTLDESTPGYRKTRTLLRQLSKQADDLRLETGGSPKVEDLDPAMLDRLRDLGYAEEQR